MLHILLVDDEINFRRSLMIQLEIEGYTVTEVESGSQALSFLRQCESNEDFPKLVISDVRMPDMNGGELVLELKKRYPKLPVVVISAFALPDELEGYPFIRKPFKFQDIVIKINEGLSLYP